MIRFFDILFSALGLIVLSPLFLVLYLLIRLESRGGGFYSQQRIGLGGKPFRLYKFRSMTEKAEADGRPMLCKKGDNRPKQGTLV